jgi:hypothetical protein
VGTKNKKPDLKDYTFTNKGSVILKRREANVINEIEALEERPATSFVCPNLVKPPPSHDFFTRRANCGLRSAKNLEIRNSGLEDHLILKLEPHKAIKKVKLPMVGEMKPPLYSFNRSES